MNLLAKIFHWSRAEASPSFPHSQLMLPESQAGRQAANAARFHTRRELLRIVLRDSLNRQGIPASWLGAETLVSTSRSGLQGIHWRLLVRHWDARLLTHAVPLQRKLHMRVLNFDPLAANWLTGISWQFALPDESVCPGLPHPGTWTSQAPEAPSAAKSPAAAPKVDVIAGPVRISDPGQPKDVEADVRAELEQLMAIRQADYERHSGAGGTAKHNQFLGTEPMRLE